MARYIWLRWHRRLGLLVIVPILLLAVTGVLINLSGLFGWDRAPVRSDLLARLYGVPMQAPESAFRVNGHWFTLHNDTLMFDGAPTASCDGPLRGAVLYQDQPAVLCGEALLLLDAHGELLETLPGVPAGASALAVRDGALLVRAAGGPQRLDQRSGFWRAAAKAPADWPDPAPLPEHIRDAHRAHLALPGIHWERVLLDLHSGRLFGRVGVWVINGFGVLICALAISGVWSWFSRRPRK